MKKILFFVLAIPLFLIGFGLSRADKQKGSELTLSKAVYADAPPVEGQGEGAGESQGECEGEGQGQGECEGA